MYKLNWVESRIDRGGPSAVFTAAIRSDLLLPSVDQASQGISMWNSIIFLRGIISQKEVVEHVRDQDFSLMRQDGGGGDSASNTWFENEMVLLKSKNKVIRLVGKLYAS